jgi:hypothetical protein
MDPEAILEVFNTNFFGTIRTTQTSCDCRPPASNIF